MRVKRIVQVLMITVFLTACMEEEVIPEQNPFPAHINFFALENEEWNFVFEGRSGQYSDRQRIYQRCRSLGDTVMDLIIQGEIVFGTTLHCKLLEVKDSFVYFGPHGAHSRISREFQLSYYDTFLNRAYVLKDFPNRTRVFRACDYNLSIGDTTCYFGTVESKDILWVNGFPYTRYRSSTGEEIIQGISISDSCGPLYGDIRSENFYLVSANYRNDFFEYTFFDR